MHSSIDDCFVLCWSFWNLEGHSMLKDKSQEKHCGVLHHNNFLPLSKFNWEKLWTVQMCHYLRHSSTSKWLRTWMLERKAFVLDAWLGIANDLNLFRNAIGRNYFYELYALTCWLRLVLIILHFLVSRFQKEENLLGVCKHGLKDFSYCYQRIYSMRPTFPETCSRLRLSCSLPLTLNQTKSILTICPQRSWTKRNHLLNHHSLHCSLFQCWGWQSLGWRSSHHWSGLNKLSLFLFAHILFYVNSKFYETSKMNLKIRN